ncbi:MAG: nucleoside deaminase [Armatimonadetes bacterium]|nr:MAG: nucleoside deaminase [Armatimonadota bacterium]
MTGLSFTITLPSWVRSVIDFDQVYESDADKMDLANALAMGNVANQSGGPFGAAIFEESTHRLIAPGVNLVVPEANPTAHAEIVAIGLAGSLLGRYDLSDNGARPAVLASSVEPCAMCLGAVPWSGVSRVIIGARDADARKVGFDEGDKPSDWVASLESRGITVTRDVQRQHSVLVLNSYVSSGGEIYNTDRGTTDA